MEETKKITKRIGSFTFGLMMILIGLNILFQTITSLDLFRYTLSLWPIVFISLGIETLYYSYKKDIEIKYDILGVITIFIVLFLGMIFSTINYGINKVIYNKDIKTDIISYFIDRDYTFDFENKVSINNISGENITVKFVEDKEANNVSVKTNFKYNDLYTGSILKVFDEKDTLSNIFDINYDNQKININNIPDYIKNIEITVTSGDISKIEYNGPIVR